MGAVTSNTVPSDAPSAPEPAALTPLHQDDPPKIGGFWLDARLTASASGVAFVAHDDANTPVMRDRLAGAVDKMHIDTVVARGGQGQNEGRLGRAFRGEADDPWGGESAASGTMGATDGEPAPLAPWVALAYDGSTRAFDEASRLLSEVDLSWLPSQGRPGGPDYEHYWIEQGRPGLWRLWPLPWPGRGDRSGWLSILASWLLMLLLMCLAVLVAILLFQNAPQQTPPPPVPTSQTGSGGTPSSASGSPSSSSSPSQSSSSSPSQSPSDSSSPSGSPSQTASGGPTTQSRL
jgi:hypothetical protein